MVATRIIILLVLGITVAAIFLAFVIPRLYPVPIYSPFGGEEDRFLKYLTCSMARCYRGCDSDWVINLELEEGKGCNDDCVGGCDTGVEMEFTFKDEVRYETMEIEQTFPTTWWNVFGSYCKFTDLSRSSWAWYENYIKNGWYGGPGPTGEGPHLPPDEVHCYFPEGMIISFEKCTSCDTYPFNSKSEYGYDILNPGAAIGWRNAIWSLVCSGGIFVSQDFADKYCKPHADPVTFLEQDEYKGWSGRVQNTVNYWPLCIFPEGSTVKFWTVNYGGAYPQLVLYEPEEE